MNRPMRCTACLPCLALILCAVLPAVWADGAGPTTSPPKNPSYARVTDHVYLQEIPERIPTDAPVTAVATYGGKTYAVLGGALHTLDKGKLLPHKDAPGNCRRLFVLGDALWATTEGGVYRYDAKTDSAAKVFDEPMVDLCVHNKEVHGATSDDVYRFTNGAFVNIKPATGWLSSNTTMIMADGTQVLADPVKIGPIKRIASYSGTLYLLRPRGPVLLDGAVLQSEPVDWGAMPSTQLRDMLAHGSRLAIATDRGVTLLRGASLTTLGGKDGLPCEDATCLVRGFANDLWIGTTTGAVRQVGGDYHYFGAGHWMPGENVHDIAVDGRTVTVATDKGIGIIHYEPYTLRKKAAYFERNVEQWGHKRLGFVHKLHRSNEDGWIREISDNDGGHTSHFLAAMCFKYAVTGDESARREATDSFEAMEWLQTITGTDGFFARAIWAVGADKGERSTQGSGGLPAKWYATNDGRWQWKGDTSSDEVNGHFYSVALYHDLVAQGDEKKRAANHLARITKHIIKNGWVLRDMDGQPTRWGRWDPDYLLRPYGFEARGLNGMEAQAYIWTALSLTGDPAFREGLDQLIKWRYHTYTVREKLTFPPESVVTWDDELAFRCLHPLIIYCSEPYLRSIYLRALERHWEVMRMQKLPFFNFVYGGLTGNDCEAAKATQHLREWSLDTVSHSYRNSHRDDLFVEPGYTPLMGGTRAISPRNKASQWGSRSAIHYDGGGKGRIVTPPVGWLEDYWMGRYYGMIRAPAVKDPKLTTVSPSKGKPKGAAAYAGPPRPGKGG